MKALVTGAGSGIGRALAVCLGQDSYDILAVGRDEQKLHDTAALVQTHTECLHADLSNREECFELYQRIKDDDIEIVINNAGFGVFGPFSETDLGSELSMLDVNIESVHILTKLFIKDFIRKNHGYILNVASAAAFLPGPLFSSYYASKAYVLRLTVAIREELRRTGVDGVYAGALCPGPVATPFNDTDGVVRSLPGLSPMRVARYALRKMYAKRTVIVPGLPQKLLQVGAKLVPESIAVRIVWSVQKHKLGPKSTL